MYFLYFGSIKTLKSINTFKGQNQYWWRTQSWLDLYLPKILHCRDWIFIFIVITVTIADWEVTVKEQEGANGRESFALRLHLRTCQLWKLCSLPKLKNTSTAPSIELAQSEGKQAPTFALQLSWICCSALLWPKACYSRLRCNHWIIVGAPDYSVSIYQVKPNPAVFEKLYLCSSSFVFEFEFWYSPIWDIYIEYQQASWFNFFCISIILLLVFVHCCHCICAFLLCIGVPP